MSTQTEATTAAESELAKIQAVSRLAFARTTFPELRKAEAEARLVLAAAIIAMDDAGGLPGRHNLYEQELVNTALAEYGQALANLIRGETGGQ